MQDIIDFVDETNEGEVIIFFDQQKAFDRMEGGWLNCFRNKFTLKQNFDYGFKHFLK